MSQLISAAANSTATKFDTSIPELSDSADIEVAFRLYHYGTTGDTPVTNSVYSHLSNITDDIEFLQATPTGGGVVSINIPHQLSVLSSNVDIPEGFIWLDSDGASSVQVSSGAAALTNNVPAISGASAHGVIWVDKDYTLTDPFVMSNFVTFENITSALTSYLTISSASSTYVTKTGGTLTNPTIINPNIQISFNQQSTSYTLASNLSDAGKMVEMGSSSPLTLTVPTNTTAPYPIGTQIAILQTGSGQVTVAGAVGVTVNGTPGLKARAQWSIIVLTKRGINTWLLSGDCVA